MDKCKRLALSSALYLALFMGAMIVLLPIFWMVITACKQPGKAFEFKFWPKPTVLQGACLPLATVPQDGSAAFTLEYDPALYPKMPFARQVTAAGEFNGWDKTKTPLQFDGQVWRITLTQLKPLKYEYKFVVNDTNWTPDRARDPEGDGNSVIVLQPGENANKVLADQTKLVGNRLQFQINRPQAKILQIRLASQKDVIPLTQDAKGIWCGEAEIKPEDKLEYSIEQPQTFSEAWHELYTLNNFKKIIAAPDFPFGRFFFNSLIVASLSGLLTVILCTMAGYAFAKKDFFLKGTLFMILMSTMMIPGMIFMVPQYAIVTNLDWINTYMGMIVPHLANIFGLFLLRQHISIIPHSLFEAAIIDGASEWQIFRYIVIPQSFPIMVTLFLMTFVSQWGNFLWQLIVNTPDSDCRTLPVGLALFKGQYAQDWEVIMAGSCFSILPIAFLFLIAQRYFIEGMTKGAIKE